MADFHDLQESLNLFDEPQDFRPPPANPHFVEFQRKSPTIDSDSRTLQLRLVGSSPLWGHLLWNAAHYAAHHIDEQPNLVKDKNVLELGAGAALPSIISALNGAKMVVVTDYPDLDLIDNIKRNIKTNVPKLNNIVTEGYIWGNDYTPLLSHLSPTTNDNNDIDDNTSNELVTSPKFDTILLSDLVFNHTEHHKLLKTIKDLLAEDGSAFITFSPHRPKLLDSDLSFFELAEKEYGFDSKLFECISTNPMFEEDDETIEIRSRVYAYFLTHNHKI